MKTAIDLSLTERMRIAHLIERMADKRTDKFLVEDAEEVFSVLKDLPVSRPIAEGSITTSGGTGGLTDSGLEEPEEDNKHSYSLGRKVECRCGTYVIMRMSKNAFDIRHVADTTSYMNQAEVLRLQRWFKGAFKIQLNNPLKIPFLPITIGGFYKTWKVSE